MGVNRVKSTRVSSVVLIHTQVLLATRGSLRDTFTEKLVSYPKQIPNTWPWYPNIRRKPQSSDDMEKADKRRGIADFSQFIKTLLDLMAQRKWMSRNLKIKRIFIAQFLDLFSSI